MWIKMRTLLIAVVMVLAATTSVYAGKLSVTITADKTTASIEDTVVVQVIVDGKSEKPEITGLDDFNVRFAGTSSQVQIINGRMSSSTVFQYLLVPRKEGHFVIGPAIVEDGGNEYKSQTITLHIVGAAAETPQERDAYLDAQVTNRQPFIGEQILYTVRFYTRVPIQNAQLDVPDFKGAWKEQIGDIKNYQQIVNGQVWDVNEMKVALFPAASGELAIDRAGVAANVITATRRPTSIFDHSFFDVFEAAEKKVFKSNPITLNVKPFPEENKPADFSGMVGSFSISTEISATKLEVGDSATLTIRIDGDGDLRNYPAPKIKDSGNFKIYDDQPSLTVNPSGKGVREVKIFKKAIVPLKAGQLTLPPFELAYFDPAAGKYMDISTTPITLDVRPSSHPEKIVVSGGEDKGVIKQELEVLGEDMTPIEKGISALKSDAVTPRLIILIILALVPFIGFVFAFLWRRRIERVRSDSGYVRRGWAFKHAYKEIRRLQKASGNDFFTKVALIIREYIGDKCNIDGRSLTAADVARRLEPYRVSRETCDKVVKYFDECDAGLYGGKSLAEGQRIALISELKDLIKELEREIKG